MPKRRFPRPPIPSTQEIVALATAVDLFKEGRSMQHCAGTYAAAVRHGGIYFYQVLVPERATLRIVCKSTG